MTAPLASVVIPCRNYGRFLREAIESVLAQTHPAVELLVVDYGSTDGSDEIAAGYDGVRLVRRPNRGVSEARNQGLAEARGGFLVFLDADDRLLPDAVASSLECLLTDDAALCAYGHQRFVDAAGADLPAPQPQEPLREDPYGYMLRMNNPLRPPGAMLYRREPLERVGGFAPGLDGGADLDLNLRLARDGRICCNDRPVLLKRLHAESLSRDWAHMLSRAVVAQRRQRAFVRKHPRYRDDYRAGLRLARSYCGAHLLDEIRDKLRSGEPGAALRDVVILARYHPAGLAGAPRRLLRRPPRA